MPDTKKTTFVVDRENLQVIMTRVFNAPRELVFKVYNDPEMIKKWWGPSYLSTIIDKMEFKVGGIWRYVQTDPQGQQYQFNGVYLEIIKPEKVSATFNYEPIGPGHEIVETAIFEEQGDKTKLINTSVFKSLADLEGMVESGMEGGAVEGMERLAKLVELA